MQTQASWKSLWGTCCPALRAIQVIGRQLWSEFEFQENPCTCSAAAFGQVLWNAARAMGQSWRRGIMGRTTMDSRVSPTSADLQMPSLMDSDQENTLYGVNTSLRELQHYFFALLLFLAKFRCCGHMSLPASSGAVNVGKRTSSSWCWALLRFQHWIRVLPAPLGLMCKAGTGMSLLHQFCARKQYTVFQSYHLFIMVATEGVNLAGSRLPWDEWSLLEPLYCLQSRAFCPARGGPGLSPNST